MPTDTPVFDYARTPTDAKLRITAPDGTAYDVPVQLIADDRDANYAADREDTIGFVRQKSLDAFELKDWAANQMDWSDVAHAAVKVERPADATDFQAAWINGAMEIVGTI